MADTILLRRENRLPSRRKHLVMSLGLFAGLGLMLTGMTFGLGKPEDAISNGRVELGALPPPERLMDLRTASEENLPDLLTGAIPETLTGPDGPARSQPRPPGSGQTETITAAPKTIRINGEEVAIDDNGEIVGSVGTSSYSSVSTAQSKPIIPLPKAPIAGYARQGAYGPVPGRDPQGRTPFSAYSKPFTPQPGKKYVSLIIGGLGINAAQTDAAITRLPANVTLAFAPHSESLQAWVDKARLYGHEVILEVPMETLGSDPEASDYTLTSAASPQENLRRLDYLMSRAQGYFALTNYLGEKFTASETAVKPMMDQLYSRGLAFYYDGETARSKMIPVAVRSNVPIMTASSIVDSRLENRAIRSELDRLSASAATSNIPLGMGFSFDVTLDAIIDWEAGLNDKGLALAPASYALKSR